MLVFKNSGVFRKVGTVPNLFWCLEAFLRGVYFWVFEPSLHLFYLIKKHISLNYSIKRRVSTLLRLKIVVPNRISVLKAFCSLDTLLLFNSKAFLLIWLRPGSNRWPSAWERETLYNNLFFKKWLGHCQHFTLVRRRSPVRTRAAPTKEQYKSTIREHLN